jgi:hypothetical protein
MVSDIPRTKSGKLVELAVRDMVNEDAVRNVEALANPESLEQFKDRPDLRCLYLSQRRYAQAFNATRLLQSAIQILAEFVRPY